MKIKICSLLFLGLVLLSGKISVYAQNTIPKQISCEPTAEEILSIIKSVYDYSPNSERILIVGEVRSPSFLIPSKYQVSLTQTIATVGGTLKSAGKSVYVVRLTDRNKNKFNLNLTAIKKGEIKDFLLEKGDVVFVPRICVNGKMLSPIKFYRNSPGVDSPIRISDKPNSKVSR